jgi:hypothetical protein
MLRSYAGQWRRTRLLPLVGGFSPGARVGSQARPSTIAISSSVDPYDWWTTASISASVASIWCWQSFLSAGEEAEVVAQVERALYADQGFSVIGAGVDVQVVGEALDQALDPATGLRRGGGLSEVNFCAHGRLLHSEQRRWSGGIVPFLMMPVTPGGGAPR